MATGLLIKARATEMLHQADCEAGPISARFESYHVRLSV